MAEQMRPASNEQAPDTARVYERARPEHEAGAGRLDNNKATPAEREDHCNAAVGNQQPNRVDGDDIINQTGARLPSQSPPPIKLSPDQSPPAKQAKK